MGYAGKLELKQKVQGLRREGLSYKEILLQVDISKDTISRWCRDIELTQAQKENLLNRRIYGQRKGSLVAADNKRRLRIARTEEIYKKAKKDLGKLTKRDRFIAGLALYSGEGDKGEGKSAFTNSDPMLIKFMMEWFKEFCRIPASKYRGAIWIHEGLSEQSAKIYWSNLTGIPTTQFHKTYVAMNKKDSKKIRKNIHEFGVFSIRFSDSDMQRRILGWISALLDGKIASVH